MADAKPPPPAPAPPAKAPTPPVPTIKETPPKKPDTPPGVLTSADVAANPNFTVGELVDLALCSPEVGAVNFNILRLLLRDVVEKTGIDRKPVKLNDVEKNQVESFKNYVQGQAMGTPMPGVLKINSHTHHGGPGMAQQIRQQLGGGKEQPMGPHGTPRQQQAGGAPGGAPSEQKLLSPRTPRTGGGSTNGERPGGSHGTLPPIGGNTIIDPATATTPELAEKVARLEKHLEALYQLPTNQEMLDKAQLGGSMSVNDMWQIIQLNNRIGAAEAAIQKMASLIEDLAKNMNRVKGEAKNLKKDAEELTLTNSDLQLQGQTLSDKCEKFSDVVNGLKNDIERIGKAWKNDRDLLQKALGVDLGNVPSFMKSRLEKGAGPGGIDETPSEQFERGTQTFVHLKDKDKQQQPQDKSGQKQQRPPKPAQEKQQPVQQQPGQEKQQPGQQQQGQSKQQPGQQKQQPPRKQKPPEQVIPPSEIAKMTPEEIAKEVTADELANITPSVFKEMTPEQKKALVNVKKTLPKGQPAPKKSPLGVAKMTPKEVQELDPENIIDKVPYDEAVSIPPEVLEQMNDEQKEAIQKVIDKHEKQVAKKKQGGPSGGSGTGGASAAGGVGGSGPGKGAGGKQVKKPEKPPIGVSQMTEEQLAEIPPETIASRMSFDEASNIPPEVMERMTEPQKDAIRKIVATGPPPPAPEGEDAVDDEDDGDDDLMDMFYEEPDGQDSAVTDYTDVSGPATPQRGSVDKQPGGEKKGPTTLMKKLAPQDIQKMSEIPPEEMAAKISPEMAASIPKGELQRRFTPEQIKEIEKLQKFAPGIRRKSDEPHTIELQDMDEQQLQEMTPQQLVDNLTESQILDVTEEQLEKMLPEQQDAVREARRKSVEEGALAGEVGTEGSAEGDDYEGDESEMGASVSGTGKKERLKPIPSSRSRKDKHHHHHHHKHHHDGPGGASGSHVETGHGYHPHVDIVQGPIPTVGEPLPPMTLEAYLASLPPEEAANLAADAVQKELQKQYTQLQGMQRQLAMDIQEKMEFIYQKLLKDIAAQQMTTSPYMAVGSPELCLGPGVCTGHGMPAGIAVCQFPEVRDKAHAAVGGGTVPAIQQGGVGESIDGKVCPGPGVCPGSAVCPHCQGQGKAQEALKALKAPERGATAEAVAADAVSGSHRVSELDEALLKEMKSLLLLDLEKIREDMRSQKFGAFDEQDIVERLGAVWEALKILKHNEEALAVKIARQDALMKKIPAKTLEKLQRIPDENLEAIASGQFHKPMYIPEGAGVSHHGARRESDDIPKPQLRSMGPAPDKEDIQTLFNNLANVIAECSEQKERIDQLADTARIMESGMVTKQMLMDALSDKADKGLINTKVSYDEFGNTIDELHTQLHNLMVEGYQRNENWKKVTSDLADELSEKLDKVELAPIRAFFKSHLKNLEEKVKTLSQLMEEPDPAGTRKRLLRDYNCLSCDRMVNISGVTNGPTLPTIGPIHAGHPTASRRALDLHRMRMQKQFDPETKNLNALERHGKVPGSAKKPATANPAQIANDIDVMHVVNRYTGGSHTAISNANRIASQRRPSNGPSQMANPVTSQTAAGANNVAPAQVAATNSAENLPA